MPLTEPTTSGSQPCGIGFQPVGNRLHTRDAGRRPPGFARPAVSILCAVVVLSLGPLTPTAQGAVVGPPPEVRVTERGTFELLVSELPLSTVLRMLSVESHRNIIASPNVTGKVTANLYDVTFEEALDAVLVANGAGYRSVGNFIYIYTNEELSAMALAAQPLITRVFPLNYITAADAESYIKPLLGDDGTVATSPPAELGLSSDAEKAGGNTSAAQDFIVVRARRNEIEEVERILFQIDVCPRQVLIEATILRAQLTDDNALGIDFSLMGGVDLATLGAASNGLTDVALGLLPQERFERFNAIATTGFTSDVPGGGMSIGIIKDKVAVFLRALEAITDTVVLANPKILALNKQKAQIIVGRRDGYLTTTVTETQAIQTVDFLETGTQLVLRPFIGDDGRIRVELHPEDSVGFVSAQGLPSEQTTEVTTNVIVRDGETILIGGLFREVTTDARKQVPGLGNLPIIGPLFRSRSDATTREEVIILLTIKIVKDADAYAAASREQYEAVERMRVGVRQGLMWHGRERISQTQYRKAVEAFTAGEKDKALYHVNMALHANGRMVPAIELKEIIVGERAWDEDGTGGRGFLHHLISQERGYSRPFPGRPPRGLDTPREPEDSAPAERKDLGP